MTRVLFVCLHNAGRSQMSRAFFEQGAAGGHEADSAGTTPGERVHPVVTMGCGDQCPYIPGRRYVDWELVDPAGQAPEAVRRTRDEIERRVRDLLEELGSSYGSSAA